MNIKIWSLFLVAILSLSLSACQPQTSSPEKQTYFYKGQLHVHTNVADAPAEQTASVVETWYRFLGYTFVALTDHFATTSDPHVGCDEANPSKCILHIDGQEAGNYCGHHLIAVNDLGTGEIFSDQFCPSDATEKNPVDDGTKIESLISRINSAKKRATIVFFGMHTLASTSPCPHEYTWTSEEIEQVSGYATGIEIFNGGNSFLDRWDKALTAGNKVWGFGTDDCEHLVNNIDVENCNRSWIVVPTIKGPAQNYFKSEGMQDELRQDIISKIQAGNFYTVIRNPDKTPLTTGESDFGPKLNVKFDSKTLSVNTEEAGSTFSTKKIAFLGQCGKTLSTAPNTNQATYTPGNNALYVRTMVEQDRSGTLYRAYSQPVYPVLSSGIELTAAGCNTFLTATMIVDFGCASQSFDGELLGRTRAHFKIYLPTGTYNFRIKVVGYEDETGGFGVTNGFTNLGEIQLKQTGLCK